MKNFFAFIVFVLVVVLAFGFCLNINNSIESDEHADYLRIHIRANSNSDVDQEVKYAIKDEYIAYLTPKLANCLSKQDVVEMILKEKNNLEELADNLLSNNGFCYKSKVSIKSEMFPTRYYEGYTLESGIYDALIVELGEATGNNWWCVIYPPLCFANYSGANSKNIVYKSKILEIIKKFFN